LGANPQKGTVQSSAVRGRRAAHSPARLRAAHATGRRGCGPRGLAWAQGLGRWGRTERPLL